MGGGGALSLSEAKPVLVWGSGATHDAQLLGYEAQPLDPSGLQV